MVYEPCESFKIKKMKLEKVKDSKTKEIFKLDEEILKAY